MTRPAAAALSLDLAPPADSLRISAVICTRNRAASLERCLAALEALDFDPASWELIVVNNGSTDATDDVVRRFASRVPVRVELVHEPEPGLSTARNRGLSRTNASIITFVDDDCYLAPDFLTQVMDGFTHDPNCGYIGGRILLHDPTDAPETIKLDGAPAEIPAFTCITPGFMHGANLSVRREACVAIGGFDRMLGPGTRFCADDIDFMARLSAAGWKGRYLPGPVVSHHHGRKPGADIDRLHLTYTKGRGAYYMKGCLNPRMRGVYARQWYWHLRRLVQDGRSGTACRELAAGIEYLWCRLTTPRRQVDLP